VEQSTADLIAAGLSLAGQVLDHIRSASPSSAQYSDPHLIVDEAVRHVESAVASGAIAVIDKIESDQIELLRSRIKNLALLLRLQPAQCIQYAMMLRESVDYARNRVFENKHHWFGPWLAGQGVLLLALHKAGAASANDLASFMEELRRAKYEVLDVIAARVVAAGGKIDWSKAHAFLDGTSTDPEGSPRHENCISRIA
jgi:hypothetical protein